jgi:methionyl-tRNA formyltransferase
MIQIIGHNEIVFNLSKTLKAYDIPFRILSNKIIAKPIDEYFKVQTLQELQVELKKVGAPTLIISAGAPWIFNDDFLQEFEPTGIFNIHGTPLPQDRGGTIVSWLILNKKRIGNSIIHKIVKKPDAGSILLHNEFIYPAQCHFPADYLKVYNKQQEILVTEFCLEWSNGKIDLSKTAEQPPYLSSFWPRLSAEFNSWINWNWSGEDIELFIRAFDEPYQGGQAIWRGKTVWLKKAFFQKDSNFHPFQWGMVYRKRQLRSSSYIAIAVDGGTLYVESCSDNEGMCMMQKINEGDRIYSSEDKLTSSKKRTIKTNIGFKQQNNIE